MTLSAKYAGTCSACGKKIHVGDRIEWDKTTRRTTHAQCPAAGTPDPLEGKILAAGERQNAGRVNRKPGACMNCGSWIRAGEGLLIFCPEDSGCLEHHDHSGYHVACADPAACKARAADARSAAMAEVERKAAEAKAKKAAEAKARAEGEAVIATATAGLACTGCRIAAPSAGTTIASYSDGSWSTNATRYETPRGPMVLVAHHGLDDYRASYYASQEVVDEAIRAWASDAKLTRAQAEEFLSKYAGCYGADDYRRFLAITA